jgi:hypothetical protein
MPLMKSTLAQELENIFGSDPSSAPDAAMQWAKAYATYASNALSKAASLPVNAMAGQGTLVGPFTSAFNSQTAAGAAALMTQGIMLFWQTAAWTGPTAAGMTAVPGNAALAGALTAIFSDLSDKTPADKASELADAFDAGAKTVIVSDIPFAQPAPPIVGPIS